MAARRGPPVRRVVVSAHVDSKATTPGAFDNAGSVAAVLAWLQTGGSNEASRLDRPSHSYMVYQPELRGSQMTDDLGQLDATELYGRRQALLGELGQLDLEFERRRAAKRRHVRADELTWTPASKMNPTTAAIELCQIVSPELGFDIYNMHMFKIRIPPRTEGGRYHRHGDAIKHYLSGRAIEMIGDETYEVEAGDFIHIPANVVHGTQNPFDEPCEILAAQQFPGTYTQVSAPFMWGE